MHPTAEYVENIIWEPISCRLPSFENFAQEIWEPTKYDSTTYGNQSTVPGQKHDETNCYLDLFGVLLEGVGGYVGIFGGGFWKVLLKYVWG